MDVAVDPEAQSLGDRWRYATLTIQQGLIRVPTIIIICITEDTLDGCDGGGPDRFETCPTTLRTTAGVVLVLILSKQRWMMRYCCLKPCGYLWKRETNPMQQAPVVKWYGVRHCPREAVNQQRLCFALHFLRILLRPKSYISTMTAVPIAGT
jgi:hypothetical protein